MNILFVGKPDVNSGVTYYRMVVPGSELERRGHNIKTSFDFAVKDTKTGQLSFVPDDFDWCDVAVFPRYFIATPNVLVTAVDYCKSKGKRVIWETDDYLTEIPEHNPVAEMVNVESAQKLMEFFREKADGITVTTKTLQEEYGGTICPNSINTEMWQTPRAKTGKTIVGWAGGWTHQKDLELVIPVLKRLKKKYQFEIRFLGFEPGIPQTELYYRSYKFTNVFSYPERLAELSFDIGIAPLIDDKFNQYKSNIKWLEYSMLGIPTVASNLPPYEDIQDGKTGYLANNPEEFEEKLAKLLENPKLRDKIGKDAKEYVINNYDIKKTYVKWEETYKGGTK